MLFSKDVLALASSCSTKQDAENYQNKHKQRPELFLMVKWKEKLRED